MKRREWMRILTLALLGAGTRPAVAGTIREVPERELLGVGDTRQYGSGFKVTFAGVSKDVRCPADDECENPGDAIILLRVKVGKNRAKTHRLHTNRKRRKLVIPVKLPGQGKRRYYALSIASLSPLPFEGKTTPAKDYRLDLKISIAR